MKKNIVINYIIEQIEKGKWKEGSKIFSEYQFQQALKVSCGTVRSAIKELNDKNILETVHGSGTYVRKKVSSQKKYILILTNDNIMNITNNTYKKLLNKLKILIEEKDYIPLCYAKNTFSVEESFNTIINDIVGVIAIFPERKEIEYFKERKIPIIHGIRSFPESEPSIIVDFEKYFQKLRELTKKYNFNDIVIFMNKLDFSYRPSDLLSEDEGSWMMSQMLV